MLACFLPGKPCKMKHTKQIALIFLSFTLILSFLQMPAVAADSQTVETVARDLSAKYGITVRYPLTVSEEPAITVDNLECLDKALENLTPAVVQQVSQYYKKKNGQQIIVSFVQNGDFSLGEVIFAGFDRTKSLVELYLPRRGNAALTSGLNPISILHEFAHAIHLMYTDSYGFERMEREWSAFNSGWDYDSASLRTNPNQSVFINGYAASSFAEDVAETLAHMLVRYQPGQGMNNCLRTADGSRTNLGEKVVYLENMLKSSFPNDNLLLTNYSRAYTAASAIKYQDIQFGGDYLQFIDYPQPNEVLDGILYTLDFEREKAVWIRALGGWYVETTNRQRLILFPGGVWCKVPSSFQAPI